MLAILDQWFEHTDRKNCNKNNELLMQQEKKKRKGERTCHLDLDKYEILKCSKLCQKVLAK